jgi:PAS domain S-box-containing protein
VTTETRARERLAPALDELPVGVVAFRDDGSVVHINSAMLALTGHARDEVVGKHVEQLLTVAGRIFFQTHLYPLVRLGQQANELFVLLRHKDGSPIGTLLNARRRGGTDDPDVTICVFAEVRERSKFEEALLRAKREAEAAAEALRVRGEELQLANTRLEEQAVELELQQEQLHEQAVEMEAHAADMVVINEELTSRSVELSLARAAAEEANKAKSQFLAVMSHELRTPLNAIGGYVQLLELGVQGPVTDGQRDFLTRVAGAQRHLLRLINEVLNLSRIEAGHVEYRTDVFPALDLIRSVLPLIEPQMAAAGLQSQTAADPEARLRADREKVEQIVINLLTNAVKFTPAGGRIAVAAARRDARTVAITVTDSGIGIPEGKLKEIFEPFVQVDTGHTRREGSGLGLAISRDLARGMGGDLVATSELGKGSTFVLTLPAG